jgi:hypothetical protein
LNSLEAFSHFADSIRDIDRMLIAAVVHLVGQHIVAVDRIVAVVWAAWEGLWVVPSRSDEFVMSVRRSVWIGRDCLAAVAVAVDHLVFDNYSVGVADKLRLKKLEAIISRWSKLFSKINANHKKNPLS